MKGSGTLVWKKEKRGWLSIRQVFFFILERWGSHQKHHVISLTHSVSLEMHCGLTSVLYTPYIRKMKRPCEARKKKEVVRKLLKPAFGMCWKSGYFAHFKCYFIKRSKMTPCFLRKTALYPITESIYWLSVCKCLFRFHIYSSNIIEYHEYVYMIYAWGSL